jgi:hypothetical protein
MDATGTSTQPVASGRGHRRRSTHITISEISSVTSHANRGTSRARLIGATIQDSLGNISIYSYPIFQSVSLFFFLFPIENCSLFFRLTLLHKY